jgi:hypothetical protein
MDMGAATSNKGGNRRPRGILIALGVVLLLGALPGIASAAPAVEKYVFRDHRLEYVEVVTDDACGEIAGGQGLRAGTFYLVENGHTTLWVYEDSFLFIDVENGTYTYDFDDPSIPDVSGIRYTSPTRYVLTKSGNENYTENQVEFLPGFPGGLRIEIRINVHWRDGLPFIEREVFNVTGCP